MLSIVSDPVFQLHDTGGHVECAARLAAIDDALPLEGCQKLAVGAEARLATDAELLSVHTPEYLEMLQEVTERGGGWIDGDTLCGPQSERVARRGVGAGLELLAGIAEGSYTRGFGLVRPPGHHATPTRPMGFCLYSNVAILAKQAVEAYGFKRVFILDWDVHHGNGTQDCLYDDPSSCFCSIHQWPLFPGSGHSAERGAGAGQGLTYNLPLPAGCGDHEYLWALQRMVEPVALKFNPDLILLSAGYDAHQLDPLGGMRITTEGFGKMTQWLGHLSHQTASKGRILAMLEGGYSLNALSESVASSITALQTPGSPLEHQRPLANSKAQQACVRAAAHWEISL
jgi:acetoin utilization deacetylase AcuC-like enzyme